MGQTPAIIVDTSSFNTTSGLWDTIDIGTAYKKTSIQLSAPSRTNSGSGIVGNFSIKAGLEIGRFRFMQWMIIGDITQPSNCTLDPGFDKVMLPTDSISDNILWELNIEDIIIDIANFVEVDFNINCSTTNTPVFSYALLTPTPTTSLDNQLLFVNYTDSTIVLEGQWQVPSVGGGPGTSSAIIGATVKFPFAGWNITLLGFFDSSTSGNITLGVSLDEQTQARFEFEGDRGGFLTSYFEYFTLVQQESDSGNHTITVEVLEASLSQAFSFRGFTYIPSFATLNDMPDLSVSTSSESSPATTSSPTSTPSSTSTSSPTSTPSLGDSGQSSHQELHGGAIAGIVVGALAGICIIELILWAAWRRIKKRRSPSPAQAWVEKVNHPPGPDNVTPFEKMYISSTPPDDMIHIMAADAHGITPFTKNYITSAAPGTDGDTGQDQEQPVQGLSTVSLPPGEGVVHMSLFPVEPPSNGNNGSNGDQATPPEPDRTELLLERLNNLMNAIQHPPAYGQEVSP
ncbi:hypothetical protein BDP27DRAFT_1362032 [Rhodocollybia butyracea]|uniref:Uncharacterized protein n=1 Tax=Rhodocollybia butyracea TaxID=206335 RepID=A0A9P5PZS8_9AGAR|nr:hypothetical protein BDP27DRAFT_1362032 [Rhodocollybia butyracea]